MRHHQAGELAQAEAIYQQILNVKRDHADALHLLGLKAHQVGDDPKAIELISRAVGMHHPRIRRRPTICRDLTSIGHYWAQYERLHRHWQQVLPLQVLEMQYEDLVDRPEQESRRLLDYCGLDWDDSCLEFHRTNRGVITTPQVRRPIYRHALEHWRNYEQHLEPLKKAIAGPI